VIPLFVSDFQKRKHANHIVGRQVPHDVWRQPIAMGNGDNDKVIAATL